MSLSIGIVGLPNVGKSTLFKTITKKQVDCANYPFCTIDQNKGVVEVPDQRVEKLANLCGSKKKIHAVIEFVDIAGLVKGASKGQGLGNRFLANIRETDAICYVLRAFKKEDIINVQKEVNPLQEKDILDIELILKDLETIEKRINGLEKEIRAKDKEAIKEIAVLQKAKEFLSQQKILSEQGFADSEKEILKNYQLLTLKPRIYILNGKEEEVGKDTIEEFDKNNWNYLIIDILTEPEEGDALSRLINKCYESLGLISFFTTGEDETRAWALKKNSKAPQAGGVIHSDFEKKFIKADVINWQVLINEGGFSQARAKGLIRLEGKEYIVQEGDVIEIKHG